MKIFSWNVNGIRSVFKTTFRDWLKAEDPDIVCLQEIKADDGKLSAEYTDIDGYYSYFNPAAKKGYAGVGVYTKAKPISVERKLGIERFDDEGRCLKLTFPDFTLFNFYMPNGGMSGDHFAYKMQVYKELLEILRPFARGRTILAGDFNIAHTAQDLRYPGQHEKSVMFTPQERLQIDALLGLGYVDTFRLTHPDQQAYTWWSYAVGHRENDIGWRIDYVFASQPIAGSVREAYTRREVLGSDHGPCGAMVEVAFAIGEPPIHKKSSSNALF